MRIKLVVILCLFSFIFLVSSTSFTSEQSLPSSNSLQVLNGSFDQGMESWQISGLAEIETLQNNVNSFINISVPETLPIDWYQAYQELECKSGTVLDLRFIAKADEIKNGPGAYVAISFFDASGELISTDQSPFINDVPDWKLVSVPLVIPENSLSMIISLIVYGHGSAQFDNFKITVWYNQFDTPTDGTIFINANSANQGHQLIGIGAEDDGWFYNQENQKNGLSKADYQIYEERVRWMDPDYIRMFFWREDWNPSRDWQSFDFETENMQSHYKTLDIYQEIGSIVNITGVEWNIDPPFNLDFETIASAYADLIEYLINEKGYTCIKQWTLHNEPNLEFSEWGYDFSMYRNLYLACIKEFSKRNIEIELVLSDDSLDFDWFESCVSDSSLYESSAFISSHGYFMQDDILGPAFFFHKRLSLLLNPENRLPFVLTEFGFGNAETDVFQNFLMQEYDYALKTMDTVITGLNAGVSGFSMWTMQSMFYPDEEKMDYGLWDLFEDELRPVFHALALFTRLTESGDTVVQCYSSHPHLVKACRVNNTIFWVNTSNVPYFLEFEGIDLQQATIFTENNLENDRTTGKLVQITDNKYEVLPFSFGSAY
jgi:hypothetical protein